MVKSIEAICYHFGTSEKDGRQEDNDRKNEIKTRIRFLSNIFGLYVV